MIKMKMVRRKPSWQSKKRALRIYLGNGNDDDDDDDDDTNILAFSCQLRVGHSYFLWHDKLITKTFGQHNHLSNSMELTPS